MVLLQHLSMAIMAFSTQAHAEEPKQLSIDTSADSSFALGILVDKLMSKFDPNTKLLAALQPWEAWISASTHNTMIDYWHYAGNCTYANQTASGIISQAGPDNDFSAVSPGNDDALWWGLTCISAAEYGFPVPEEGPSTDWLCLAKNVFSSVISRWQPDMCGPGKGGIGWQVSTTSSGHEYKNAITQGLAFQLAARLAAITKERQYEVWANKIFDVSLQAGLIDNATYQVSDGVHAPGCSDVGDERWSYNVAVFMYGAAVMHRHTCPRSWNPYSFGNDSAPLHNITEESPASVYRNVSAPTPSQSPGSCSSNTTSAPPYKMTGSVFASADRNGSAPTDWLLHVEGFISAARSNFAKNNSHILYEQRCEDSGTCNTDQQTFKAYLARWMGMTATLLPETRDRIMEVLNASAKAAIEVVNAGPNKNVASLKWTEGRAGYNESSVGVGAQLGVVEVVLQAEYATKAARK